MVKSVINLGVAAAISLSSFVVAAPAFAHGNGDGRYYERNDRGYNGDDGYYQNVRRNDQRRYDDRGRYNDRGYEQGYDSRDAEYRDPRYANRNYRYKCKSGTTGTILGGVVGGLLGREIGRGGYYNRPSTTGTIIGAGAGALAGRAIEKSGNRC